jgi:hypothetical protein
LNLRSGNMFLLLLWNLGLVATRSNDPSFAEMFRKICPSCCLPSNQFDQILQRISLPGWANVVLQVVPSITLLRTWFADRDYEWISARRRPKS